VISVNGTTGAVTGIATTGSNTFTGLQTMNAGLTTSHLYVSDGATFSGSTLAFQGTNAKTIQSTQAPLTIKGVTSGAVSLSSYNAVVFGVQDNDPLKLYSASGLVDINSVATSAFSTSIKLNTNDGNLFAPIVGSVTIQPSTYFTANRTINIPDASGTLALTGANTFSGLQTMNAGLTTNHLYVSGGATFASRIQGVGATFTGTVKVDTGLILPNGQTITSAVTTFNGASGAISYSPVIASSSATGVASFGNEFTVSAAGAVGLTSNYVKSVNGLTGAVVSIATTGSNVFAGLQTMNAGLTANNIYVTNGATFASAIQGTAASFTGLVSSTVGFSGSATNLVGNANGLTAGTASRVQIAEGTGSSYYLVLAGGAGNTGVFVDTSTPRWVYNASTGSLITSTGYVEAATLYASTTMYANNWEGFDGTSQLNIRGPFFDGTYQPMYIGDTNGSGNGTLITIDDNLTKIEFAANNIDTYGSLNVKNSGYLTFYDLDSSNYVAFRGATTIAANTTWILPSADGSANQVLTTNGLGTLSWSTPSGGGLTTSANNTWTATQSFSAGLSAANLYVSNGATFGGTTAATFNGTVNCNSSTVYKPTLQYYNEVLASPTISANVLTLDLSTAQMFTVSLNANITTLTISNTPATANRSIGFTLIFTADGTARTVTWGAAVKWANNDPPALTSTNGKKDILSFVSPDGGTNWYGFIGGLNF
jgi:cytoskeletal protein CcmA (bactofilin family)